MATPRPSHTLRPLATDSRATEAPQIAVLADAISLFLRARVGFRLPVARMHETGLGCLDPYMVGTLPVNRQESIQRTADGNQVAGKNSGDGPPYDPPRLHRFPVRRFCKLPLSA
ncbi:MAG: hypothetical protein BWY79_01065 [Actinobacteria bacterium ADurb.Bin444]|nr:MAG: hypothetical protein BWY79_01065 [Actinobacteria bacterium ADurb.Bin444]